MTQGKMLEEKNFSTGNVPKKFLAEYKFNTAVTNTYLTQLKNQKLVSLNLDALINVYNPNKNNF